MAVQLKGQNKRQLRIYVRTRVELMSEFNICEFRCQNGVRNTGNPWVAAPAINSSGIWQNNAERMSNDKHKYTSAYVSEHMSEHLGVLLPKHMLVYMSLKLSKHSPRVYSEYSKCQALSEQIWLYIHFKNFQNHASASVMRNISICTSEHSQPPTRFCTTGWGSPKRNFKRPTWQFVCIASISIGLGVMLLCP